MRVLVVEDDRDLGAFLKKGLQGEGHTTDWIEDGDATVQHAAAEFPDLIVLDLGLPNRDGLDVLKDLRAQGSDAAVLVLTGRNDLGARVQCLDAGADDCLLKPFSFLEFTARCRALLRRRAQVADPVLRHGDLELHRVNRHVIRGGREVTLTGKEFALLEYLMLHRGKSVSRSELLAQVWKTEEGTGTNIVDVYINYLRRKLESTNGSSEGHLIQTVRGTGYRVGGVEQKSKRALRRAFIGHAPVVTAGPALVPNPW